MLQKLHIKNFILIDDLEIDFSSGMNVITGETGAGKSIIIDAISLLMGQRSTAPTPTQQGRKVIIEASLRPSEISEAILKPLFEKMDWDWEMPLLLRREFATSGKSRVFVNDSPARLKDIQAIAPMLIELHQQFDHLNVRSKSFQLEVLDVLADNSKLSAEYQSLYKEWIANKQKLEKLLSKQEEQWKQRDYNQYMLDELLEADLQANEIEEMDEKMKLLENAESLIQTILNARFALNESEQNIADQLSEIYRSVHQASSKLESLLPLAQRLKSLEIETQDIADSMQEIAMGIDMQPEEREILSDRLDMANRLLTKHQVRSTEDLLKLQSELDILLQSAHSEEKEIQKLTDLSAVQETELRSLAQKLSKRRKSKSEPLAAKMHEVLANIGMEKASINIDIHTVELNALGIDNVQYTLDANKTGTYKTIGEAASGGELNRIMLAIKSIIADKVQLPTLIFDEIDSGISGEPARSVGRLMKKLAQNHQVITITHQASIAAQGDKHWYIFKEQNSEEQGLTTKIKSISGEKRAEHIAELIGGKDGGESALAAAHKLLQSS